MALWGDVRHYHGVTRAGLAGGARRVARRLGIICDQNETPQSEVMPQVCARLAADYGVEFGRLDAT